MAVLGGQELVASSPLSQSRFGSHQELIIQVWDTQIRQLSSAGSGMVTKLDNRIAGIPDVAAKLQRTSADK